MVTMTVEGVGDVTCLVRAPIQIQTGRAKVRDQGQAATCGFTMDTATLEPDALLVGRHVTVSHDYGHRFAGRITDASMTGEDPGAPDVAIQCTAMGAVATAGNVTLGAEPWPQETVADRAQRIAADLGVPFVVQGGQDAMVRRLDIDATRSTVGLLLELSASVGGWVFDAPDLQTGASTIYLQAMDARAVSSEFGTWDDEPTPPGGTWDELDPAATWLDDTANPYAPITVDCSDIEWQPTWQQTSDIANRFYVEYGTAGDTDWSGIWAVANSNSPPGIGQASFTTAGTLLVNVTDGDGMNRADDLAIMAGGDDTVTIGGRVHTITAVSDDGTVWTFTVAPTTRPEETGPQRVEFHHASDVTTATATDPESVAAFGPRDATVRSQLVELPDAQALADLMAERSAWPRWRMQGVRVPLHDIDASTALALANARPGARITITGLSAPPAPSAAFHGALEGWVETLGPDEDWLLLYLSDARESLAVPTWDAEPVDETWDQLDPEQDWESDL